MSDLNVGHMS